MRKVAVWLTVESFAFLDTAKKHCCWYTTCHRAEKTDGIELTVESSACLDAEWTATGMVSLFSVCYLSTTRCLVSAVFLKRTKHLLWHIVRQRFLFCIPAVGHVVEWQGELLVSAVPSSPAVPWESARPGLHDYEGGWHGGQNQTIRTSFLSDRTDKTWFVTVASRVTAEAESCAHSFWLDRAALLVEASVTFSCWLLHKVDFWDLPPPEKKNKKKTTEKLIKKIQKN